MSFRQKVNKENPELDTINKIDLTDTYRIPQSWNINSSWQPMEFCPK
jgi:hypothetical protein